MIEKLNVQKFKPSEHWKQLGPLKVQKKIACLGGLLGRLKM